MQRAAKRLLDAVGQAEEDYGYKPMIEPNRAKVEGRRPSFKGSGHGTGHHRGVFRF
jgi:hypothetical protein